MKRLIFLLLTVVCILGISSCKSIDEFSSNSIETTQRVINESTDTDKQSIEQDIQWTEQDIRTLFVKKDIPSSWTITDCVVTEDNAYDCVGVVLFIDSEKNTSNVAFMEEDGTFQHCGISAKTCEESELTYLGNGVVTFQLKTEDEISYTCKITFSIKDRDVSFIVEDSL